MLWLAQYSAGKHKRIHMDIQTGISNFRRCSDEDRILRSPIKTTSDISGGYDLHIVTEEVWKGTSTYISGPSGFPMLRERLRG